LATVSGHKAYPTVALWGDEKKFYNGLNQNGQRRANGVSGDASKNDASNVVDASLASAL
jgi:hypothetical protein